MLTPVEARHDEIRQLQCVECGRWNDPMEKRCAKCGHALSRPSRGGANRREAEISESVPPPSQLEAPPEPEPEWKRELSERLAGYRKRKVAAPANLAPAEPEPTPEVAVKLPPTILPKPKAEEAPLPPPKRFAPPFRRRSLPSPAKKREIDEMTAPVRDRAIAGLLDIGVVLVALGVFVGVIYQLKEPVVAGAQGWQAIAVGFAALLVFYWVFYYGFLGRTAGMAWMTLKVVNFDGLPPSPGQRRSRALGAVLSTASAGLGFVWALADQQKLTWHDRISRTLVTRDSN